MYDLWNAKFLLQLSASHFKFPLSANSHLDKEDVHLTVQHCPIHPLKLNTVHVAEHVSQFLSSPRISSFMICSLVETYKCFGGSNWLCFHHKDGGTYHFSLHGRKRMDDKFLSVYMVSQPDDSSLYRHCYENLNYHSKAKNDTSISSSVHKIAVCPKFFTIFKIKIIANKQQQKEITVLCFLMLSSEHSTHKEDKKNKFFLYKKLLHFFSWLQILLQTNAQNYSLLKNDFMLCGTQDPLTYLHNI